MKGKTYRSGTIRDARVVSGKTIETLAKAAGVSTMQWWRLEHGRGVSLELIQRAAVLLGLEWRELLNDPKTKAA